jgi:hypothetical protein
LCLFLLTLSGISTVAEARGLPMKAQNRVHGGGLWSPGTYAVNLGFDSRMTQSISMDVGAFISPATPEPPGDGESWILRHGLYVTPGLRVPHRNPGKLLWDVIVRGGFGPVWVADAESAYSVQINPALVGGADFMLRYKEFGFRLESRAWYFRPFSKFERVEVTALRPQIGASVLYEF